MKKSIAIILAVLSIFLVFPLNSSFAASKNILGDTDSNGDVTITDATRIQKVLAELCDMDGNPFTGDGLTSLQLLKADVDYDGSLTIVDATVIQKFLAELIVSDAIGNEIVLPGASSIAVSIGAEPETLDPALNSTVDGETLLTHLFSGLAKWEQNAEGKLEIVPDAAEELVEGKPNDDGTVTYTYTLRDGLKWSDGKDVTAADFEFAWQRAASTALAADYGYMFEVVDGYAEIWATNGEDEFINPGAKLNVKAVDGRTLEVTLTNAVPYWNELLAFPAYFPVREDVVENASWASGPETYVCNGMYTLSAWTHNSEIVLKKNPDHPDADKVKMDEIDFYLTKGSDEALSGFGNGTYQMIDEVPVNDLQAIMSQYPDEFFNVGQIGTYYVCWNINENILPEGTALAGAEAEKARSEIRSAVSLLLDRGCIVNSVTSGGQLPASSFVAMGLTDADGTEFCKNAGTSETYDGYYDVSADAFGANVSSAVETLKKYYSYDESTGRFKDFPAMTYVYNNGQGNRLIAEYIQSALAQFGITLELESKDWPTFLNVCRNGEFTIARSGWIADYNDPITFLDMWTTDSGNNNVRYGRGEHARINCYSLDLTPFGYDTRVENGTWAQTYDVLISAIKSCADKTNRYAMMHLAEDMLMQTGCVTPLYYYTDQYMLKKNVRGFFSNPLGCKFFMYCTVE